MLTLHSFHKNLKLFYCFIAVVTAALVIPHITHSQTPIVNNGGFENYQLPLPTKNLDLTWEFPQNSDYSKAGVGDEDYSWINICLGYCIDPEWLIHPVPDNCNGWYTPTGASADYANRFALESYHFQVPLLNLTNSDVPAIQRREPFGYVAGTNEPNAYCGIFADFLNEVNSPNVYQEYIQSRLNTPLVHGRLYNVSFHVSRAADRGICNSYVHKLGAYLSNAPVLNLTQLTSNGSASVFPDTHTGTLFEGNRYSDKTRSLVKPQVESNFPLNQSADETTGLGGWMKIEGDVFGDDKNGNPYQYITIGCFDNTGEGHRNNVTNDPIPPTNDENDWAYSYY